MHRGNLFIATLWEERSIAQPFQKSQRTSVPYLLPSILQYVVAECVLEKFIIDNVIILKVVFG